jgi:hypothetical protein
LRVFVQHLKTGTVEQAQPSGYLVLSFRMATAKTIAPAPITEVSIPLAEKSAVDVKTEDLAEEEPLSFDPKALKEKYLAERDRRLARNEGVEQYTLLDGKLTHYLKDPWVEPGFTREPVKEETDVVVVGGGYGAQVVAVRLIEAGIKDFRIIEKAGDFGGTWYVYLRFYVQCKLTV